MASINLPYNTNLYRTGSVATSPKKIPDVPIYGTDGLQTGSIRVPSVGMTPTPAFQPISSQLATDFRAAIGDAPTVQYNSIAPMLSQMKPATITGLPDDYFNSQKEQLKSQLRDEFFSKGGTWDQSMSNESAAGRLGSGVGRQMLQKTVTEPFIKADQAIDSGILQAVMSERARVESYNADQGFKYQTLLANAMQADSTNKLQADTATASLQADYAKLMATLQDAEAGRLSQQGIAQLDADTRIWQSMLEDRAKANALAVEQQKNLMSDFRQGQANQIDYLRTPINDSNAGQASAASGLASDFGYTNPAQQTTAQQAPATASMYGKNSAPSEFPPNPTPNQTITASSGYKYQYQQSIGTWVRVQ